LANFVAKLQKNIMQIRHKIRQTKNSFTKVITLGELLWRKARHIFLGRTMFKSPLCSPNKILLIKDVMFGETKGELKRKKTNKNFKLFIESVIEKYK